jgi:hypothetical protein
MLESINFENRDKARNSLTNALLATAGDVNPVISKVNEITDTVNFVVANVIVATNVSTTINFGSLQVGDRIIVVPVADTPPAGTTGTYYLTCATAGTLPAAAVVDNLYVVLRAVSL